MIENVNMVRYNMVTYTDKDFNLNQICVLAELYIRPVM